MRSLLRGSVLAMVVILSAGCKRQHFPKDKVDILPYPTCEKGGGAPEILVEGELRSGGSDTRMPITERFRLEKRPCPTGDTYAAITHQEWPVQIADVEVVYDANWKALRAWRRQTVPGSKREDGHADTKVVELRTKPVGMKHKNDAGVTSYEALVSPLVPEVVIGQGRGMITGWIQHEKLAVGQKVRRSVIDIRNVEKISTGALERTADLFVETLGRTVRVYTFFGKETVFTDENDVVIGDLAGLVDAKLAKKAMPAPIGPHIPMDPVNTP